MERLLTLLVEVRVVRTVTSIAWRDLFEEVAVLHQPVPGIDRLSGVRVRNHLFFWDSFRQSSSCSQFNQGWIEYNYLNTNPSLLDRLSIIVRNKTDSISLLTLMGKGVG